MPLALMVSNTKTRGMARLSITNTLNIIALVELS